MLSAWTRHWDTQLWYPWSKYWETESWSFSDTELLLNSVIYGGFIPAFGHCTVSSAALWKLQPWPFLWQLCSLQRSLMYLTAGGQKHLPVDVPVTGRGGQLFGLCLATFKRWTGDHLAKKCLTGPSCAWSAELGCLLQQFLWRSGCRLKQLFVLEESGSFPGLLAKVPAITQVLVVSFSTYRCKMHNGGF